MKGNVILTHLDRFIHFLQGSTERHTDHATSAATGRIFAFRARDAA